MLCCDSGKNINSRLQLRGAQDWLIHKKGPAPGLSVGDAAHIAVPAPPNGASIQGDLLIGTTSLGNAKAIIDGTGKLVALEVQGTFYFIQLDKGPIQKTLDGKCWLLVPEPQPDGLTALPKYYLVTCPY